MDAKFNGILEVFKDAKLTKKHKCPFYGFRILVYVNKMSQSIQCGEIEWAARYCYRKQTIELGKQIASDFQISLVKKPKNFVGM